MPDVVLERQAQLAEKKTGKKDLKVKPLYLGSLLKLALSKGFIQPSKLPFFQRLREQRSKTPFGEPIPTMSAHVWFKHVLDGFPDLRNSLTHGQPKLMPGATFTSLAISCDIINQLFPKPNC